MNLQQLKSAVASGELDSQLRVVYPTDSELNYQKERIIQTICDFEAEYGYSDREAFVMSAPGRTEVCGNHTDHNNGKVLAASINLDAIAVVCKNDENIVRVKSKGHKMNVVDLNDLEPKEENYGHSTSMVKGIVAGLKQGGYNIGGFDACTVSDVMGGSGLSSSAAFEVLLGTVVSHLFNDGKIDPVTIAKVAQYSENVFFGKPCGLLDQMASSVGNFVTIDFKSTEEPVINKVEFDLASYNHSLCILDTGGNHSDLTDDYAAVRGEMEAVAEALGKKVLRELTYEEFFSSLSEVSKKVNDRAILRAIHFFNENRRVEEAVSALENKNFEDFKAVITESGYSSYMYNQNVYTPKNPTEQKLSLALAISEELLKGKGAYRVHGGGFAGTVQAFVPNELLSEYKRVTESVFGEGSCHVLSIRALGGCRII